MARFSLQRQEGQGLAEYALILSLIAIVVIAVLLFLGGNIKTILSTIGNALYQNRGSSTGRAATSPIQFGGSPVCRDLM